MNIGLLTSDSITPWAYALGDGDTLMLLPPDLDPVQAAATLRGHLDLVLVHGGAVTSPLWMDQVAPPLVLRVAHTAGAGWPLHTFTSAGLHAAFSVALEAESYGSLICSRWSFQVWTREGTPPPPKRTHGPAALVGPTKAPRLWDTVVLAGLGAPVPADNADVARIVLDAHRGQGPLYLQPGFCTPLPRAPMWVSVGDARLEGLLVAPSSPGDPWRMLSVADLQILLGYPPDQELSWELLLGLVPVPLAAAFLRWSASFFSSP